MDKYKLFHGDCLEVMKTLADNSVDCVITSPTYEDINGAGYTRKTKDVLFLKLYSEFMSKVFAELYRVIKPNGQLFFNIKSKTHKSCLRTPHWLEFIEGFEKFDFKSYIIWKYAGSFDSTNKRLHLDYEIIYHLSKGEEITLNRLEELKDPFSSVWYIPHSIPNAERLHPTQMPIAVAERIVRLATNEGDTVLDCFLGSGTSGVASLKHNRNFVGVELNPDNFEIAQNRIEQVFNREPLFAASD